MQIGSFTLHEQLARGSMGDVWRGSHGDRDFPVAVKFITPEYASRPAYRRHFYNEIRSAAGLHHPGIIQVYDYGTIEAETELADDLQFPVDTPYFAMEFAARGSLDELDADLEWPEIRSLMADLLRAVGHAHARDIIHRDLKPSNVLLGATHAGPRFKVSDFGLAFHRERSADEDVNQVGTVGTPLYMAPEQFRNRWRDFGPWTDLYGLGCLAWKLTTGSPPFADDPFFDIARAHISKPLPAFEPTIDVPNSLGPWLARMLEKHPSDRFRRAADARWALLNMPADPTRSSASGRPRPAFVSEPSTNEITPLEPLADVEVSSPRHDARMPALPDDYDSDIGARALQEMEPTRRTLPPVPEDWTERTLPPLDSPRMSVGLELFALREIPTVGRQQQRDRLWENLRSVVRRQKSRLLLLRGDAGVGKTRLARWLREYAEEVGAAEGHVASHHRRESDGDGLHEMLASHFGVAQMDPVKATGRIERWYRMRGVEHSYEWHAMSELLRGGETLDTETPDDNRSDPQTTRSSPPSLSNAREVRALIRRFLEYASLERPRIVHLDDLQWGLETLHFLRSYFESERSTELPVLFVGTIREDALVRRPLEARLIEELEQREVVETIGVGPMTETDRRRLVEELLYLAPPAARRVLEYAGGNPLHTVELVRNWVDRSLLEPGSRGFELADDSDRTLPESLYDVWASRLRDVTSKGSDGLVPVLQLAAALGMDVDESEWRAACKRLGVTFPARLIQALLRRRLMQETDAGWHFAHNMLRQTLVLDAREAGRWDKLNEICAQVVSERPEGSDERLARYWLEAGERERAFEPFLDAADHYDLRVQHDEARRFYERALECAEYVDLDEHPRLDAKFQIRRGRAALIAEGTPEEAEEAFRTATRRAEQLDDPALAARARTEQCHVAHQKHEYERAVRLADDVRELLSDGQHSLVRTRAAFHRADALRRSGQTDRARRAFEEATAMARERYPVEQTKCLIRWAYLYKDASELQNAQRKARRALELSRRVSSPDNQARIYNLLGDIARERHHIEEARNWYRQAERLAVLVDHWGLFHVHLGRVQLELEESSYRQADRLLERVRERTDWRRHTWLSVCILAFDLRASAGREAWSNYETKLTDLEEELSDHSPAIPEVASSLRNAAVTAAEAGHTDHSRRLARAAMNIWSDSDLDDLVAELNARGVEFDPDTSLAETE